MVSDPADKGLWSSQQRIQVKQEGDRQMFEPEYENITCPKCHTREMYYDRKAGHYCMFCGRQFSPEEVESLRKHEICQVHAVE
jgi:DNA-directed RNA polymerase subunit RPC12/RpoP